MSADVVRGHRGDGGGDDRLPPHESARGCRGKGTWKPNLRGRKAGRMHTSKETQNLRLRKTTDKLGPHSIRFEWKDNGTLLPLAPHAIRALARYQEGHRSTSWQDLHGQQIPTSREHLYHDPKNMAQCAQNARNRAKSTVICRQGSRTLAALRDMQMQSSATQEYPSLIQTFFDTHTVGVVFLRDEDRRLYEEMVRLQGLGTYTDDQIMVMVRRGKQSGHIPSVGRVLAGRGKDFLNVPAMSSDDRYSQLFTHLQSQHESGSDSGCGAREDDESGDDEDADEDADS
nr:hypothetical protein [Tanacetum cinerariifolium]